MYLSYIREILRLERVKVFVSHTGASSSNEAILSATPVVCIPFFGDQNEFCARFEAAGSGFYVDKFEIDVDDLRSKIDKCIHDDEIHKNAQKLKAIMDCGGAQKAAEIILKSYQEGTKHLIPYSAYLPWYQKHALDLRLTQFCVTFMLPFFLYFMFKLCLKCICCKKKRNTKRKQE